MCRQLLLRPEAEGDLQMLGGSQDIGTESLSPVTEDGIQAHTGESAVRDF